MSGSGRLQLVMLCLDSIKDLYCMTRKRNPFCARRDVRICHAEKASGCPLKVCDARPFFTSIMGHAKYA
ncbi:unnamed protein product [Amoebophrya sp. A120]|nr:unnamed protein product [Amoebophrya sp. A120]|eukprot:GSA120T00013951001.1